MRTRRLVNYKTPGGTQVEIMGEVLVSEPCRGLENPGIARQPSSGINTDTKEAETVVQAPEEGPVAIEAPPKVGPRNFLEILLAGTE